MYLGGVQITSESGMTVPGDATVTQATFDQVVFDDLNVYDPSNPNQLIIPAGCHHARFFFGVNMVTQTAIGAIQAEFRARLYQNGADPYVNLAWGGILSTSTLTAGTHTARIQSLTQLQPVTPGDVWTLQLSQLTGQTENVGQQLLGIEFYD